MSAILRRSLPIQHCISHSKRKIITYKKKRLETLQLALSPSLGRYHNCSHTDGTHLLLGKNLHLDQALERLEYDTASRFARASQTLHIAPRGGGTQRNRIGYKIINSRLLVR